ncbi:MAG: deoxyribonuclease V [Nitrospirota bacterium]|nr:deoxyribonuclease V [Nitrospirota bacterium]
MKWPKDIARAKKVQEVLKKKVRITSLRKSLEYVAGVDAAFFGDKIVGVACLYKYPEIIFVEEAYSITETSFPYIPGFLSFREGQAIIQAIYALKMKPHVILFDGQGIAHPKGFGIAAHIGVLLDIPTIGCAKSRLVGNYREPGFKKGNRSSLIYNGKIVGAVLRTRDNVRPVFVSPGHRTDLKNSIKVVLCCTNTYRIPEPLRSADFISKKIKRELLAG